MKAATAIRAFELDERRLDELLKIWERWMSESPAQVFGLGYPAQATGCHPEPWGYWEDTAQHEYEALEYSKAEAINAAIDDLPTIQQMAVYHHHRAAVFVFKRADLDEKYWEARQTLRVGLPARGVY